MEGDIGGGGKWERPTSGGSRVSRELNLQWRKRGGTGPRLQTYPVGRGSTATHGRAQQRWSPPPDVKGPMLPVQGPGKSLESVTAREPPPATYKPLPSLVSTRESTKYRKPGGVPDFLGNVRDPRASEECLLKTVSEVGVGQCDRTRVDSKSVHRCLRTRRECR